MSQMHRECDGKRTHLPWGVPRRDRGWSFATAEECEYPKEMCDGMARIAASLFHLVPSELPPVRRKLKATPSIRTLAQRAAVGRQAKGRRLPPVVPECKEWATSLIAQEDGSKLKSLNSKRVNVL